MALLFLSQAHFHFAGQTLRSYSVLFMGLNRCLRFCFHLSTCMLLLCYGLCFQFACQKSLLASQFVPLLFQPFSVLGCSGKTRFAFQVMTSIQGGLSGLFRVVCLWLNFSSLCLRLLMLGSSRNVSMLDMCQVLKQALY